MMSNFAQKGMMKMKLSQIVANLLAQTPLTVKFNNDREVDRPNDLFDIDTHHIIGDAIFEACQRAGLSVRASAAFSEWLAELITGFATRYSNEFDVLHLDDIFGQTAYNDRKSVVRLYLAPTWDAIHEHLPNIQRGIAASFEAAKSLE